jgi:ABC-2 type transport system ATP-binding protein
LLHGPIETVYRQIQRNRQIEVRFTGNPEAGVSLIRSDPKIRDVNVNHRSCTIELDGDDADVQRLLRQLVAADCGLVSFAEKEPTLEDVFMMVTKGLVT